MINIARYAKRIQEELVNENVEKFKIFVRINYNIDVYIFTSTPLPEKHYADLLKEDTEKINNLNIRFNIFPLSEANDPFYTNLFVDGENDIDWGPRYRFNSLIRSNKSVEAQSLKTSLDEINDMKMPIVTFYSYKGGMGRTTTMVAYAINLAIHDKKRVVIIDCDLEAPGYLNFFDLSEHKGLISGNKNGLVEFLSDVRFSKNPESISIDDYIVNVGTDKHNKAAYNNLDKIWLVPAGNLNEDLDSSENRENYLEGLSRQNLSSVISTVEGFKILFKKLKETIQPDIILIDSRTGFNDIFGTVAFYLSKYVVGFFGYNRQTIPGLMNLLSEYYNEQNSFSLHIVSSILPEDGDDTWVEKKRADVINYANYFDEGDGNKALPAILSLHRNHPFELIGTGDQRSDEAFIEIIREKTFKDYNILFKAISDKVFPKIRKVDLNISTNTPSLELRNIILKRLKEKLETVTTFAEDGDVSEERFFYRDCMKELFNPRKFLIQGYKGTGKTYLYKALGSSQISGTIQRMVAKEGGIVGSPTDRCKFINVLPEKGGFDFKAIKYSQIEEPEFYFNCFWQIHTWNAILLDPEFQAIKGQSELKDEIRPISGYEPMKIFDRLISNGVDTLIVIEKDIKRLNTYLAENHIKLFVMYDRLDSCINPLRWNKAVSPLIDYWRENWDTYSNIIPKIFVRTDLFRRVEGTNTARLSSNTISLEWSIGEVFGYFFKLIFSDEDTAKTYWVIAEKVGIHKDYIQNTKREFADNFNQFKSLLQASMDPLIRVFFGQEVNPGNAHLGSPWDYFSQNLANADRESISLRPFIRMLNGNDEDENNAIEQALAKTERHVTEIISPDIYASRKVRIATAEKYFNDLAQDSYSVDILKLKNYINSNEGEAFRFKSLNEGQFDLLMQEVYKKIGEESEAIKSIYDLTSLIFANGIMAEKVTTGGKYYRFAPIYWYAWGLGNSEFEKKDKFGKKKPIPTPYQTKDIKGEYKKSHKCVETIDGRHYDAIKFTDDGVYDGANVLFDLEVSPRYDKPNYKIAVNIRFDE